MSTINIDGLTPTSSEPASGTPALPVHQVANPATPIRLVGLGAVAQIKATAGRLIGLSIINDSAAAAYVQLLDAAAPTLGTTAPVLELKVAAGATVPIWFGDIGIVFLTAIKAASTTTSGGAVASAAGVQVAAHYK